ncbi:MAG: ABC transporter permease [Veillonellales bacterium]
MEISPDLFRRNKYTETTDVLSSQPGISYWQDAWRRLKTNTMAMIGGGLIIIIALLALGGPLLSPYSYSEQQLEAANQPPSAAHWFGTDNLGRDLLTRLLYGARISLSIGLVASLFNLLIGVVYGGIAGYSGSWIDSVLMRIIDILYGIPLLLYVILLMVVLGPGLKSIFIALGLVYWLQMARIVRGQVLALKNLEYVLAAKVTGATSRRIILRHLIPNIMGPIIVTMTLAIPEAIFTEAFLSFIGLGVAAPMASWGVMASEGVTSLRSYPFQLFFPGLAICLTILSFNFLGDGLRDALDPRMRK